MNNILTTILKETYTIELVKHKLKNLKGYLLANIFNGTPIAFDAEDLTWLKSLPPAFYKNFNKDNVYDLFTTSEKELEKVKVLTIYLPFEPDNETLSLIGNFAKKTFTTTFLLDIKYDPKLIAGASLVWNGMSKDYSLLSTIEQKKQLILENLKKYLR